MKVAIGADHGGFELKEKLTAHLRSQGHDVQDAGTTSASAVDYPVFARKVADLVAAGRVERGIMIDGAGIGSSMVANKVPGVRAAMAYDVSSARNGREHNDANLLTLGAGLIGANLATQIVDVFLTTECTEAAAPAPGGHDRRHAGRRVRGRGRVGHHRRADLARIVQRLQGTLARRQSRLGPRRPLRRHPVPTPRATSSTSARAASPNGRPERPGRIPEDLARYIDHTILKPDATAAEVDKVVAEAREWGFRSVCVNPCWVKRVADGLRGSGVLTCSVVGFPLGASLPEMKGMEARRAIRDGAKEIDMVINVGALKGGDDALVLKDIRAVVDACRDGSAVCKVIIETALLTDEEKVRACELAKRARANFVKTSTGFASGGATAEDIALMASVVRGAGMEVKASGGIRSFTDAKRMIAAGATRIGASASIAIVQEAQQVTVSVRSPKGRT